MLIESVGSERFKIRNVVQAAPVVIAEVETLPDDDDENGADEIATKLAAAVAEAFNALLRLNLRMGLVRRSALLAKEGAFVATGPGPDEVEAAGLAEKSPSALSWWVASYFVDSPSHQQALLQEPSTRTRLRALLEVLSGSARYLRARAAVEGALAGGSGSGGSEDGPPPGGPD
jgi:hypothetical protein